MVPAKSAIVYCECAGYCGQEGVHEEEEEEEDSCSSSSWRGDTAVAMVKSGQARGRIKARLARDSLLLFSRMNYPY